MYAVIAKTIGPMVRGEITAGPVKHASTLVRRASEEFCGTILSFHVMW